MTWRRKSVALVLLALWAGGCRTPHRSVATEVDPDEWTQPAEIVVSNADTLARCDLSLYLCYDTRFCEDTLTLWIEVRTPDSLSYEEPFLFCANLGRKAAAVRSEAVAAYRKRAVFGREGDYRFLIRPARPVTGVDAVGVYVEREAGL